MDLNIEAKAVAVIVGKAKPISKRMPVTAEHSATIIAAIGESDLRHFELASPEACRTIIAEIEAVMVPIDQLNASDLARKMIGMYPKNAIDDPKYYLLGITSLFSRYPPDICVKTVDDITLLLRWPPSRASLSDVLEGYMLERKRMLSVARRMIAEHERREQEARALKAPPLSEDEIAQIKREVAAEYREKHGREPPLFGEPLLDKAASSGLDL